MKKDNLIEPLHRVSRIHTINTATKSRGHRPKESSKGGLENADSENLTVGGRTVKSLRVICYYHCHWLRQKDGDPDCVFGPDQSQSNKATNLRLNSFSYSPLILSSVSGPARDHSGTVCICLRCWSEWQRALALPTVLQEGTHRPSQRHLQHRPSHHHRYISIVRL